jgi:hypothetical protein
VVSGVVAAAEEEEAIVGEVGAETIGEILVAEVEEASIEEHRVTQGHHHLADVTPENGLLSDPETQIHMFLAEEVGSEQMIEGGLPRPNLYLLSPHARSLFHVLLHLAGGTAHHQGLAPHHLGDVDLDLQTDAMCIEVEAGEAGKEVQIGIPAEDQPHQIREYYFLCKLFSKFSITRERIIKSEEFSYLLRAMISVALPPALHAQLDEEDLALYP